MYVWVENPVNYIASGQGNHQRGGIKGKTSDKQDSVHTQSAKKPSLPRQTISAEIPEV